MKKKIFVIFAYCRLSAAFQIVDINQASLEQLSLLPGVGDGLAALIVEERAKKGSFKMPNELMTVKGMTAKKFAAIESYITSTKVKIIKQARDPAPTLSRAIAERKIIEFSELERHMLQHKGLERAWDESIAARARKSGLLPKISLGFDIDKDFASSEKGAFSPKPQRIDREGLGFSVGLRASLDLDRILYNSAELEVAKVALKRLDKEETLIKELQKNYFSYLRTYERGRRAQDEAIIRAIEMELAELAIVLDSMTGGAFSRALIISSDCGEKACTSL
jgi:hypothetical protein